MLIILVVLAGLGIMCGTIFVVRDVEVVDANPAAILSAEEKNNIVTKTELHGKNILFSINQNKIKANIKACDPMYKVHSIKTEFPNKVVIKISRRVPIYWDQVNSKYYDADMYVVKEMGTTPTDCVDITGANLQLKEDVNYGDLAVGKTSTDNRKINQLKLVAAYFPTLSGFTLKYNDDAAHVGGKLICLHLTVAYGVTFELKTMADDDFAHLLAFVNTVYQNEAKQATGNYKAMYHQSGKCTVKYTDLGGNGEKTYVEK